MFYVLINLAVEQCAYGFLCSREVLFLLILSENQLSPVVLLLEGSVVSSAHQHM
uniref:Uncharacterized protein n=1 Tax=Arundo donax TaxID=35708 RepID=A0A0A9C2U6_ARUDO